MDTFMTIMGLILVVMFCIFFIGIIIQLIGIMLSAPIWIYIVIVIIFIFFMK
jgi:hypothetical protein